MSASRAVAAGLLAATALLKIIGLFHGSKWLSDYNQVLQVQNWAVAALAAIVELALAFILLRPGSVPIIALRSFLVGLSLYHSVRIYADIKEPCKCLGRLLDWFPWIELHADGLTLLLLLTLAWLTRFEHSPTAPETKAPDGKVGVGIGVFAWILLGSASIYLNVGKAIGGDEALEASKLALLRFNPSAASQAWNDQGWIFTQIVSLFSNGSGEIHVLRSITFALTVPIPLVVGLMLRRHGLAHLTAVFSLLVFAQVGAFELLTSMTMEGPAVGLASLASIPLLLGDRKTWKLVLSGSIAALALQLKFTAAFGLVPVAVLAAQSGAVPASILGASAAGTFLGLCFLPPGHNWTAFLDSHTARPPGPIVWEAWQAASAGLIGALAIIGLGRRGFGLWVGSLAFAVVVLSVHQPAWGYYHLHFWIPGAALAVWGIRSRWMIVLTCIASLVLVGFHINRSRSSTDPWDVYAADFVPMIRKAKPATLYSTIPQVYLSTGVAPDPALMIVPFKRVWRGFNYRAQSNVIERLHPEMLVLTGEQSRYVSTNGYVLIAQRGQASLLALPTVPIFPEPPRPTVLKLLGL
jgi:hypothetical protein